MKQWKPNLTTKQAIDGLTQTMLDELPAQLGIDEIIPSCEVINDDTYGVGVGVLPRYITVALGGNEHVPVLFRGGVTVTVGAFVTVLHYINGDLHEVLGAGGAAGFIIGGATAGAWLALAAGIMDFEPDLPVVIDAAGDVVEYATIVAAIAGAAAGEAVVIPPGTYDESITLKAGVWIGELVAGTVIINSTSANTAVTCADNGYLKVKEINVTRNVAANAIGIYAAVALTADCIVICEEINVVNTHDNIVAGARGIHINAAAGSLFVKADLMHVSSERFTHGLLASAGGSVDITLEISRVDVTSAQEGGYGIGLSATFGGSLRLSNAYWIITGGTGAAPAYGVAAEDCADLRMSDCQFFVISASAGAAYGIRLLDDITAYLYDCVFSAESTGAGVVYGLYVDDADALCEARNVQFSAVSSGNGTCYGVRVAAGRGDLWHCTIDTSTAGTYYDLYRNGGILSIYSVTNYKTFGQIYFRGHTGLNLYTITNAVTTIIPDSIGDVAAILTIIYAVSENAGGVSGGTATVVPTGSVVLYNDGVDVLTLAVAVNGTVTLQRTAGGATFNVSLNMVWI